MKKLSKILLIILSLFCVPSLTLAYYNTSDKVKNVFQTESYSFNLNATGGNFSKTDVEIINGKTILPSPIRTGYNFSGFSESLGSNVIYTNEINNINDINNKNLYANWNTQNYTITYNLNGGIISNNPTTYTIEDNITLPIPTRTGYSFIGWTGTDLSSATYNVVLNNATGDRSYIANWEKNTFQVDINSIIQNVTYSSGLSTFGFSVWIDGVLVADNYADYYNGSVSYGSSVRVLVHDRDGYSITSFRDQTWIITGDTIINPTWYDNIAPTITSFSVENLGYFNPSLGTKAGWNIRIYINGYDNGTGIQKYQTWLVPYGNGSGSGRKDGAERLLENVLYLHTAEGRTFCAYAIDNAGNEASKCETLHVN